MKPFTFAGLLALAFLLPGIAVAATAYTVGPTNVRTGPGAAYPAVALISGGARVEIVGCIKGYSWCKLKHVGRDAWIASSRLEFVYQGRRVVLGPSYYVYFGAPIIVF